MHINAPRQYTPDQVKEFVAEAIESSSRPLAPTPTCPSMPWSTPWTSPGTSWLR